MKLEELRTLEDVQAFLEGAQTLVFEVAATKAVRYRIDSFQLFETVEETAQLGDSPADEGQRLFTPARHSIGPALPPDFACQTFALANAC